MTTASEVSDKPDLSGFTDIAVIETIHLKLFSDAMDVLDQPSAKPADLADVLAWILRPARIYKDGRLAYDGMKVPFSWQLACKAVGVDPELYREQLAQDGKIPQDFMSMAQYLAEWKVVQTRDEKSERKLNQLLGPNCKLSAQKMSQVLDILESMQFDMFGEFDIPDDLPAPTVERIKVKKAKSRPIESIALF